jgi:hypothetical protein
MDIKNQFNLLVDSLKLLSSCYEDQKKSLPDFVNIKDEVISSFEDAFLLMPQLIEKDYVTKKSIISIIRCYNWMELVNRDETIADKESFINHDKWQKIRYLARKALEDINDEKTKIKPDNKS